MRPALKPRHLGHLRDMLLEKDEDLQVLRQRLQTSEELHGDALARLERLESHIDVFVENGDRKAPASLPSLSSRLEALEQSARDCRLLTGATHNGSSQSPSKVDFVSRLAALEAAVERWQGAAEDTAQQLHGSQRLVEQLQEQLKISSATRTQLISESQRWRAEAEAHQAEAGALRQARSHASNASAEVESLRGSLAQSVREASLLRAQLAAREADVGTLELRVAELEGAALSTGVFGSGTAASFGDSGSPGFKQSCTPRAEDRAATKVSGPAASSRSAPSNGPVDPPTMQRAAVRRDPQRMASAPVLSSNVGSWATAAVHAEAGNSGGAATPHTLSRSSSPKRMVNLTNATTSVGSPEWPSDVSSGLIARHHADPRLAQPISSPPYSPDLSAVAAGKAVAAHQLQQPAPALEVRSQSVPVGVRRSGAACASAQVQGIGAASGVSLASWAAAPGGSRHSIGSRPLAGGMRSMQTLPANPMVRQANPFMGQVVRR